MAAKRADYFEAGTLVVWDVDPVAETVARIGPIAPTARRLRAAARRPTPSRPCRDGGSRWIGSSGGRGPRLETPPDHASREEEPRWMRLR